MANASALLGTFSHAHDDQGRRARWAAIGTRISTGLMVLAILTVCIFAVRQLWIEWQTASVDSVLFWFWLAPALGILLVILRMQLVFAGESDSGALRLRVQVVRRALLAGDTQLAPLAAQQPQPLDQAASGGESLRIGPLRPLADPQLTLPDVCGFIVLTFGFVAALLAAILIGIDLTQPLARNNPPLWLDASSSVAAVVLLGIGVPWMVHKVRGLRPRPIQVDALGLRWLGRAGQAPLPWSAARAFYTVSALSNLGEWPARRIYVLNGGNQLLAWQRSDSRFDHTREASDRLAGLIVARTGLPLRDLSLAFDRVTEPQPSGSPQGTSAIRERMLAQLEATRECGRGLEPRAEARMTALIGKLAPSDSADAAGVSNAVRQALEGGGLPAASPKSAAGKGCLLLLAAVVAFALLAGASWSLQQLQTRYLASLPAQIHAESPLYADSLAALDGNWLVSGATANGARYQDQSFRLTGTAGCPATAWTPANYGDVAVEVTARQLGGTQSDGIGLVVRANASGNEYVAFAISPTNGGWTLWQYHPVDAQAADDWHYLAGGDSTAIHRGYDASNMLLAITRGHTYVLYVNGVFVGAASDGDPDVYGDGPTVGTMTTPRQGSAGVYLADGITMGVFSNFAVYRVQPPPSPLYA